MTKTLNINITYLLTVILGLFVLIYYVFQVGAFSQDKYTLYNYEERLSQLLEDNEGLEINFSKANSLSNIEEYLVSKNFVRPDKVSYIQLFEGSVVSQSP